MHRKINKTNKIKNNKEYKCVYKTTIELKDYIQLENALTSNNHINVMRDSIYSTFFNGKSSF